MTKSDGQQFLPIHESTKRGIIAKKTHTHAHAHAHAHTHTHQPPTQAHTQDYDTLFLLRERYNVEPMYNL